MATLRTEVELYDSVLSLSREPLAFWPLLRQLEAAGVHGELRMVDEQTGHVLLRYRLGDRPEEGDQVQPLSA
jgi:hypothetical protein